MENANYSLNNCEKCFTIPNGNFKLKCDCCSSKAKLLLWQSVFCFRFVSHIFHILKFHCNSPNTWLVFADKPLFSNLLVTKVILKRYLVLHCNPHPTTNTTTHTTTTTTHTHTQRKQTKQERDKRRNREKWTWNWTSTYFDASQCNSCDNQWKVQAIMENGVSVIVTEAVTEATRAIILQCNSY